MKKFLILVAAVLTLASCGQTRSGVTGGLLFTSWNDTISGIADNSIAPDKAGEACTVNVLGLVASGDSSIESAKRNGGIKKVAYTDTSYFNLLGIYQEGCTVVKGQ